MNITQDHALAVLVLERQKVYHQERGIHRLFFCGRCRAFDRAIAARRDLVERTLLARYDDPEVARRWLSEEEWKEVEKRNP